MNDHTRNGANRAAVHAASAAQRPSLNSPDGPALTPDYLLDLHVLLNGDGWFDELVALVRGTAPG